MIPRLFGFDLAHLDITNPAIADAVGSDDRVLYFAAVVNDAPCATDGLPEHVVGNVDPAPNGGDQLISANHAMTLFDEVGERLEDFGLDQNWLTRTSELAPHGDQVEVTEPIGGLVHDITSVLHGSEAAASSLRGYHCAERVAGRKKNPAVAWHPAGERQSCRTRVADSRGRGIIA